MLGFFFFLLKKTFPPVQSLNQYLALLPRWKLYFHSRSWTESAKPFRCLTIIGTTGITKFHSELCWLFFAFSVGTALSGQILSTSRSSPLPAKAVPWSFSPEEHVWLHRYWKLHFTIPLIFMPHRRQTGWAVPGWVASVGSWKAARWAQATSHGDRSGSQGQHLTHRLFLSMQGTGWTCQGASDVLHPIFCLKMEREPWKLSLWGKWATVTRRPKCFPTVKHHIRILPGEADGGGCFCICC